MTSVLTSPSPPPAPPRFNTAADWLHALGDVPPHRILLTIPPGTATAADVIRLAEGADKRLVELVNGTLVEKAMGFQESVVAAFLITVLGNFVWPRQLGVVTGEGGVIRMLMGNVRIPDVAFFRREDLPGGRLPADKAPLIAPALAVEVLSDSNTEAEMRMKIEEYFQSGVRAVWTIDLAERSARLYAGPTAFRQLTPDDALEAPDLVPGFSLRLGDVFEKSQL